MRTDRHHAGVRRALALLLVLGVVLVAGCGSRNARRNTTLELAAADAAVRDGCYDCLRRAREVYARLAGAKGGEAVAVRLFETDLLLALREKELALDWSASVERARTVAPRLPAALEPARLLAMVDAVLPDQDGLPQRALGAHRRRIFPYVARVPREVAWLAGSGYAPAVRAYLTLAVECTIGSRTAARAGAPAPPAVDSSPLVTYRASFCTRVDTAALRRVQEAVPGFVEAAYLRGESATAGDAESGGSAARALFDVAHARFPTAPGLTFAFGWLEMLAGDCDAAVRHYDETIAVQPLHERAWHQRTICLSNQRRDSAAIESATRLIALRAGNAGEGYYWRALSRLRLGDLPRARGDADTAKARSRADNYLTLAGVIEHDQGDLPVAERDLRDALQGPSAPTNCTAASYLARVLTRTERWRESTGFFEQAMGCFDGKVATARERIATLAASGADPAYVAARIARLAADSAEQRRSYHTSAFNAATAYARLAEFGRARELLDVAARDTARSDVIARLRAAITKARPAARTGGARR
jgi:hypothetical protein